MGILGMNFGGTQPQAASLLGQFYDPAAMKRQMISQALMQAGVGLLGQGYSSTPKSILGELGTGLKGAVEGAQQGKETYMDSAFDAYSLDRQKNQDERKLLEDQRREQERMERKKALYDFTSTLDPAKRAFAEAFPDYAAKGAANEYFPDPNAGLDRQYKQAQIDALGRRETTQQQPPSGYRWGQTGNLEFVPGGPADPAVRKAGGGDRTSATELKEKWASQDELPAVQGTIQALTRAKELNKKTYTGTGAGVKGYIGSSVPGASLIFDPETANATREFGQIMSLESIKAMSETLKGATTNFELSKFEQILSDPSTPPPIRERVIDRMLQLAEAQKQIKATRVQELGGGEPAPVQGIQGGEEWTIDASGNPVRVR